MLDKELLVFPVLSLLALVFLIAGILGPVFLSGQLQTIFENLPDDTGSDSDPWLIAIGFVIYFITYFVIIFFNSALIACVKIRFAGGDPTVMDGLRSSISRLPLIAAWALFTSSVGFVLRMLESKSKGLAKFLLGLFGAGWAIASYFAVPVLVSEKTGPIAALKRSVSIIKKTWGETLVAEIGMSALYFIVTFIAMACLMAGAFLFETSPYVGMLIWAIGAVWIIGSVLIFATLDAILKAALYVYAVDGKIPDGFDDQLIKGAFRGERNT